MPLATLSTPSLLTLLSPLLLKLKLTLPLILLLELRPRTIALRTEPGDVSNPPALMTLPRKQRP